MPATIFQYGLHGEVDRELDENGNVLVEYTREPDGTLISEHRNGVSRQYHFDGDGNTLALTDDNGDVTDTFAYSAFGEVTERTGTTPTPFQYKGQHGCYRDSETGDYLVEKQPLDATKGRYLSVVPNSLIAGYVPWHNNPNTSQWLNERVPNEYLTDSLRTMLFDPSEQLPSNDLSLDLWQTSLNQAVQNLTCYQISVPAPPTQPAPPPKTPVPAPRRLVPCGDRIRPHYEPGKRNSVGWETRTSQPSGYVVAVNGCSSPIFRGRFLIWDWTLVCNDHDRCYGKCGANKKTCDDELYAAMKGVCRKMPIGNGQNDCYSMAWLYYMHLDPLGNLFREEQDKACIWVECSLAGGGGGGKGGGGRFGKRQAE